MAVSALEWARIPVTRIRTQTGEKDQYGEPTPGAVTRTRLHDALFAPTGTSMPVAAGVAATLTEPTVYWRHEWPDVQTGDLLEVDGDVWRVNGRPQAWPMGLVVPLSGVESTRGA